MCLTPCLSSVYPQRLLQFLNLIPSDRLKYSGIPLTVFTHTHTHTYTHAHLNISPQLQTSTLHPPVLIPLFFQSCAHICYRCYSINLRSKYTHTQYVWHPLWWDTDALLCSFLSSPPPCHVWCLSFTRWQADMHLHILECITPWTHVSEADHMPWQCFSIQ